MKILLATPLYPPEMEELAVYSKRFAEEMFAVSHEVSLLAYSDYPELINGVKITVVSKKRKLLFRLFLYTRELYTLSRDCHVIYAQNTLASGLPSVIIGKLRKIPVIIHFSEDEVWKASARSGLAGESILKYLTSPRKLLKLKLLMILQRRVLRNSRVVVVPNKTLGELLEYSYRIPKENVVVLQLPAPRIEYLPFETYRTMRKIVFLSQFSLDETISVINDLKPEVGDCEIVVLSSRFSRAEKWHHLKSANFCVFTDFDSDSLFLDMALVTETPRIVFKDRDSFKKILLKIFNDLTYREALVVEGKNSLNQLSWKEHLRNFISIVNHIR